MTDLNDWITQQITRVERAALQAREDIAALLASGDVGSRIAERHVSLNDPASVLRRCAAGRKILARHRLATEWPWAHDAPCHGCGVMGDCDDPVTENVNDCPELLDLADGYGITPEQLAALDRPQLPPRTPPKLCGPAPDTSRAPAALRGPNWKGSQ